MNFLQKLFQSMSRACVRALEPEDQLGPPVEVPEEDFAVGDGKWIHLSVEGKYSSAPLCQRDKFVMCYDSTKTAALVTCPECLKCLRQPPT